MPKPLTDLVGRLAGNHKFPTSESIRTKLEAARLARNKAEVSWRTAAAEAEAWDEPERERAPLAAVRKARDEVARLEAILAELTERESQAANDAKAKASAEQDARTAEAFDRLSVAAGEAERAIARYVAAISAMDAAYAAARAAADLNPRAPADAVLGHPVVQSVKVEIARVCGTASIPGADVHTAIGRDLREVEPLAAAYAQLAAYMRQRLGAIR